MSYKTALNKLPRTRQEVVESVLDSWENGSQALRNVSRNLKREVHLPLKAFSKFLKELSDVWRMHPNDIVATGRDYDSICLSYSLRGTKVSGQAVLIAGRAGPLNGFVDGLFKYQAAKIPVGLSPKRLKAKLRRLASDCRIDPVSGRGKVQGFVKSFKKPLELARRPVWCTFRNPARDSCPFVPPLTTSSSIANALGLPAGDDCGEMLLFRYDPAHRTLFIPTVADARRYGYFTPAGAAEEHGWTTPLDEFKPGGTKQPEAVHDALEHDIAGLVFIHVT